MLALGGVLLLLVVVVVLLLLAQILSLLLLVVIRTTIGHKYYEHHHPRQQQHGDGLSKSPKEVSGSVLIFVVIGWSVGAGGSKSKNLMSQSMLLLFLAVLGPHLVVGKVPLVKNLTVSTITIASPEGAILG